MKVASSSERLKEAMEIRELRQADLISRCRSYERKNGIKIYSSILSQYLSGKREIGTDKLIVLAEALNVSERWLAGYDVPMERSKTDIYSMSHAVILADAAKDPELISCIEKIQDLKDPSKKKVYGYVDALHDAEC